MTVIDPSIDRPTDIGFGMAESGLKREQVKYTNNNNNHLPGMVMVMMTPAAHY